jgi:hypothetical protein
MFKSRRSKIALLVAAALAVYVGGYLFVRSQHWLVHRAGFAYGKTDSHAVTVGDLGLGAGLTHYAAHFSYFLFAPLRWAETAFWSVRHPVGTPWPY